MKDNKTNESKPKLTVKEKIVKLKAEIEVVDSNILKRERDITTFKAQAEAKYNQSVGQLNQSKQQLAELEHTVKVLEEL